MEKTDNQSVLQPVWEGINSSILSPLINNYDSLSKIELVILCGLASILILIISRRSLKKALVIAISSTAILVSGVAFTMMSVKLIQASLGFGRMAEVINPEEAFGMAFGTSVIAFYFFFSLRADSTSLIPVVQRFSKVISEEDKPNSQFERPPEQSGQTTNNRTIAYKRSLLTEAQQEIDRISKSYRQQNNGD